MWHQVISVRTIHHARTGRICRTPMPRRHSVRDSGENEPTTYSRTAMLNGSTCERREALVCPPCLGAA
jgi:hypothetical protein